MPDRDWVDWASQPAPQDQGRTRKTGGRSAVDMLTSSVDETVEDAPDPTEDIWYATEGMVVGPSDTQDSDPDAGPP